MKVSCLQEHLAKGLATVSRAVTSKAYMPVLSHVLLETQAASGEGRLRLAATNLDLGIAAWIHAQVEEEGAVAVPARLIADFVNTLPPERVDLILNAQNQTLRVKCGRYNASVKGIAAGEFPKPGDFGQPVRVTLAIPGLRERVERVTFAAATNDLRPVLTGVLFRLEGNTLSLAAADGFRLSVQRVTLDVSADQPISLIIPAKALQEVARLCADEAESVEMTISGNKNQVCFHLGNAEVVSQLIGENYPDLSRVIPEAHTSRAVVSVSDLRAAVKALSAFTEKNAVGIRLTADAATGCLSAAVANAERGDGIGKIDAAVEGESFHVSLQAPFLLGVLERLNSPQAAIEFLKGTPPAPVVIRPVGDGSFIHVVMPMVESDV